jgi:hypothetical protein
MTDYPNPLVYTDADFRTAFPFFANTITYTEASLQLWFTQGTSYISAYNRGWLRNKNRQLALYQMTAHLAALNDIIVAENNAAPGLAVAARIDKIQVTLMPPPVKSQFQWWLNLTPYGQQLLALLQVRSAGGWSVGGTPELAAFRRVGGVFRPGCY